MVQIFDENKNTMIALSLKNVSFSYDENTRIIDDVSVDIDKGMVVGIKGVSGCGKSTLALIACGVIPKSINGNFAGDVNLFGKNIKGKQIYETAKIISMVFQDPEYQFYSDAVVDEVAFAPENLCYVRDEILASIDKAITFVNMNDYLEVSPRNLSGGQQQLVALASILSLDTEIIILDEIAAQIDKKGIELIKKTIATLKQMGTTIIIIEHKNDFTQFYDKVYTLSMGKLTENE